MLPVILLFGTVALLIALSGKAEAKTKEEVVQVIPSQAPPALLLPSYTKDEHDFVSGVVAAMNKGNATLDMMRKAYGIAQKHFPATAEAIKNQLDKALTAAKAKAKAVTLEAKDPEEQLAALITSPDAPPSPVPQNPKTGQALWTVAKRKGHLMAIPNFTPVLNIFKKLQAVIGAKQDGRIGNETLVKFRNAMSSKGYTKFPTTVGSLAANATKYIVVLTQNIPSNQVGAHGGSALQSPFPGC